MAIGGVLIAIGVILLVTAIAIAAQRGPRR
jgi:hypothetical protein